jgi:hypothetical protein
MHKFTLILISLLSVQGALGQSIQKPELLKFNKERKQIGSTSMAVLGGFALGNMAIGIPNAIQLSGKEKYFNEMNCYWNVVNLGISIGGYIGNQGKDIQNLNEEQTWKEQSKTMKIYGINAGLDLLYIGSGVALMEFSSKAPKSEQRLLGYGESLIVQGGFLLLYDSAMLLIHGVHGKNFKKKAGGLSFSNQGIGMHYTF